MKLLSILSIALGFHFSFAAEIPVNTEAELKAASPELMKLLKQVNLEENKSGNEAAEENLERSAKSNSEDQDQEFSSKSNTN